MDLSEFIVWSKALGLGGGEGAPSENYIKRIDDAGQGQVVILGDSDIGAPLIFVNSNVPPTASPLEVVGNYWQDILLAIIPYSGGGGVLCANLTVLGLFGCGQLGKGIVFTTDASGAFTTESGFEFNQETGLLIVPEAVVTNNLDGTLPRVPNVLYGTQLPPAEDLPEGTIFLQIQEGN